MRQFSSTSTASGVTEPAVGAGCFVGDESNVPEFPLASLAGRRRRETAAMGTTRSTNATTADVAQFLGAVADPRRRADALALCSLLQSVTGAAPVMWGPSIVGFGTQRQADATSDWFVVGFAPRAAATVVYGLLEDGVTSPLLAELGPHTTGKGCLNLKRFDAVDADVLKKLVEAAWNRRRATPP